MSLILSSGFTLGPGITLTDGVQLVRDGLIAYLDAGLAASYPGPQSATWYDLSGQGADATLNGNVTFVNNGASSYFTFDGDAANYISSSLTQEYLDCTLVFYPDFSYNVGDANIASAIGAGNDITLRFGNANGTGPWTISNPGNSGDWVMVGTTATYYINNQAYPSPSGAPLVDGWNILGAERTNALNGYYTNNRFAYVWGTGYGSRGYKGKLAAILLYNRVLTADEQQQNYQYFTTRKQYQQDPPPPLPTGLTINDPSTSAWQIKQDYPASTDGVYWIQNNNINSGTAVQVYCDMTTLGGGWTLLVQNNYQQGWDNTTKFLRNSTTPPSTLVDYDSTQDPANNYSIIGWADYIKKTASAGQATFDYMMDAGYHGRNGGAWTANEDYSFVATYDNSGFGDPLLRGHGGTLIGFRKNITEITKFNAGAPGETATWDYAGNSIEARMPYIGTLGGQIQGSSLEGTDSDGEWWGTIISHDQQFNPAPWMASVNGTATPMYQNPNVIWYWVR